MPDSTRSTAVSVVLSDLVETEIAMLAEDRRTIILHQLTGNQALLEL